MDNRMDLRWTIESIQPAPNTDLIRINNDFFLLITPDTLSRYPQ